MSKKPDQVEELSKKTRLSLYKRMMRVREVEEKIVEVYPEQQMRCPVHLSIGQEAAAAGICEVLGDQDPIFGNHRSHGHYVAKYGDLRGMFAEMYGKETGCCHGFGGSMHLLDPAHGIVATTPIVGGTIPVAVGAALAVQMRRQPEVVTIFLGDGALEEGVFHESFNFAALKKLPMIFFCENNFYSVYTHLKERQPQREIVDLARGHGVRSVQVDGNDIEAVYRASREAYEWAKSGKGPAFIEAITYRWREHCGTNFDNHIGYRTEDEFLLWKDKCPVARYTHFLLSSSTATQEELDSIRAEIKAEVEDAVRFAKSSPFPQTSDLSSRVYPEARR